VEWSFLRFPESIAAGRTGVEHLRGAGEPWSLVDALGWLSLPLGGVGSFEEGLRAAEESLDLATRLGHVAGEIIARRGIVVNRTPVDGDLESLERALRKDLELTTSIQSPWASQSRAWLAVATTMRGSPQEGLEQARQAVTTEPESAWSGIAWTGLLFNRLHAGDGDDARRLLEESTPALLEFDVAAPAGAHVRVSMAGEAAAVLGLKDLCVALYPSLAAITERLLMRPFDWALTQRVAGMAAGCAGQVEQSIAHFEVALQQAASLPNRIDEPQVKHRYGEMLLSAGGPAAADRAHGLLDEALAGYRALRMPLHEAAVEGLLASR
jgi:hypothetical protein